jgi:hypothetical protein
VNHFAMHEPHTKIGELRVKIKSDVGSFTFAESKMDERRIEGKFLIRCDQSDLVGPIEQSGEPFSSHKTAEPATENKNVSHFSLLAS